LTIDLLETDSNAGSVGVHADDSQEKWSAYIDRFIDTDDTTASDRREVALEASQQPVLLRRFYCFLHATSLTTVKPVFLCAL